MVILEWTLLITAATLQTPGTLMCLNVLQLEVASEIAKKKGKKLLISLGGDTCDGSLGSAENAKKLAYYIWNMFLGGKDMQDQRPFLWYGLKYLEVFYSIN